MVRKETCPRCRGDKYVSVQTDTGRSKHLKCPECNGAGFKIQVVHHFAR